MSTAPESLVIKTENDVVIWSQDVYSFVRDSKEAPASAEALKLFRSQMGDEQIIAVIIIFSRL